MQKYHLSRMKMYLGQLSSKYIGPKIWSDIPEKMKLWPVSVILFKVLLILLLYACQLCVLLF